MSSSPAHPPAVSRSRLLLFLCFFFVSGACGLVYEVVWTRMLGLTMGHTVYSLSTVLTAFMGGLALGSSWGGRLADRARNPLQVYGILEAGIAVACLAVPMLIAAAEPLFGWSYRALWDMPTAFTLVRFGVCALILLIPTTLMGATLPVLSRYFVRRESFGASLGALYALNTLGAAAGACMTGFWLIPNLGQTGAILLAAAGNIAVALASLAVARRPDPAPLIQPVVPAAGAAATGTAAAFALPAARVGLVLGLSGFASMVYQVAWTRVLSLNIGSSTYAFTVIVTAFILGLGLGSLLAAALTDRVRSLTRVYAGTQLVIAIAALAIVPVFGELPSWLRGMFQTHGKDFADSFAMLHLTEFAIVFALFLVPTLVMGATFPLAAKLVTHDFTQVGRSVGRVYAANTVGAILGSFGGGFVLLPLCGLQGAIEAGAAVNLAAAALAMRGSARLLMVAGALAFGLPPLFGAHLLPRWDARVLDSGVYLYAIKQVSGERDDGAGDSGDGPTGKGGYRPVFFREGVSATVSVYRRDARSVALRINGKTDASTTGDLPTQLLVGHLPMMIAPNIDRVLVIGLGSGLTLGAMSRYPAQSLDYVELCPEVDEAARLHFKDFNGDAFRDPRVRAIINDGRNHVALTDRVYDVISSQPTNLWIAGVGSLFTQEYFRQCRARLAAGGVLCQWLQAYKLGPEDFRSVLATFRTVFPECTLWEPKPGGDYALIGFTTPLHFDLDRAAERFAREAVKQDLRRVCVHRWQDLCGYLILGPEQIQALAEGATLNTDDRAFLEFSTPRSVYRSTRKGQLEMIQAHRIDPVPLLLAERPDDASRRGLEGELTRVARAHALSARGLEHWAETRFEEAREQFEKARTLNPTDPIAAQRLTSIYIVMGQSLIGSGQAEQGLALFRTVLELNPTSWEAENNLGFALLGLKRFEQAREHLEAARAAVPDGYEVLVNLGVAELSLDHGDAALRHFEAAIAAQPDEDRAYIYAARLYRKAERLVEAERAYVRAIELRPGVAVLHHELAGVYSSLRPPNADRAREEEERARDIEGGRR